MKTYDYGGLSSDELDKLTEEWQRNLVSNARYILKKNHIVQGKFLEEKIQVATNFLCRKKEINRSFKYLLCLCKEFGYSSDILLNLDLQKISDGNQGELLMNFLIRLKDNTLSGEQRWQRRVNMVPDLKLSKFENAKESSEYLKYQESCRFCTCQLPGREEVKIILFEEKNGNKMNYELQIDERYVTSTFERPELIEIIKSIVDMIFEFMEKMELRKYKNNRTTNEIMKNYVEQY